MSRPEFPQPYCVLPSNCISRIVSEKNYYDSDPERAEREQADRAEQAMLEEEMERQQYEEMLEAQEREEHRVCPWCGNSMTPTKHGYKCVNCGHEE